MKEKILNRGKKTFIPMFKDFLKIVSYCLSVFMDCFEPPIIIIYNIGSCISPVSNDMIHDMIRFLIIFVTKHKQVIPWSEKDFKKI